MQDQKYVVFKKEDLINFVSEILDEEDQSKTFELLLRAVDAWKLEDAVVIRQQDEFAPPALDGYANSITAATRVIRNAQGNGMPVDMWSMVRQLEGIADYFHQAAVESWNTQRKIPD
jgi:hypothetical protein